VAIKYNLTGIAGNVNIATLMLHVKKSTCEGTKICTLSVITSDWISNECSWIYASTNKMWDTMGGDFSIEGRVTSPAKKEGLVEIYTITNIIKEMLGGTIQNRGFILEPASKVFLEPEFSMKGHNYYSSEHPDIRLRPALILEY